VFIKSVLVINGQLRALHLYSTTLVSLVSLYGMCFLSPPVRRQWGRRDRPAAAALPLIQDENFHHLLFAQHHQPVPLDESRQYGRTSTPPRMLHLPPQSPIMVDLHDQVAEPQQYTREEGTTALVKYRVAPDMMRRGKQCPRDFL